MMVTARVADLGSGRLISVDAATDTAKMLAMGSGVTPGGWELQERRTGDECEARELLALIATLRRTASARPTLPTHPTHPGSRITENNCSGASHLREDFVDVVG